MSRGIKAPFKSYEGRQEKDKHIRLTKNQLMDKVYLSLKPCSKVLYSYMKLWACGDIEFDYSISLGEKIMSHATVVSAAKELIKKGFIEKVYFSTGGGHKSNRYKFSNAWQNYKTDINK